MSQTLKDISEPLKIEQEKHKLHCHLKLSHHCWCMLVYSGLMHSHHGWSSRWCMPEYSGLMHFQCQVAYLKSMSFQFITGGNIDYKKDCCLKFGSYVQIHEFHDNSMLPRKIGAIALRPSSNNQGGQYFFSLESERGINRSKCTIDAEEQQDDATADIHSVFRFITPRESKCRSLCMISYTT